MGNRVMCVVACPNQGMPKATSSSISLFIPLFNPQTQILPIKPCMTARSRPCVDRKASRTP